MKAGIKRAWMPAGATVLFGEWGRYEDQFNGICGNPGGNSTGLLPPGNRTSTKATPSASLIYRLAWWTKVGNAITATDAFFGSAGAQDHRLRR